MKIPFKKSWWPYLLFALAYLVLSLTGTRAEVFGFLQRGLLATGLMRAQTAEVPAADPEYLREEAYELVLADTGDQLHRLSEFRGKVVLVNLWATWCPPCIAEMPGLESLYQKTKGEVAFVMISRDRDFELAKQFVQRKGYHFPIYYAEGPLPEQLSGTGIPTTYVIAPDGRLAFSHTGMADYDHPDIEKFLRDLKK
ncbi:MAG TPA: TlpA disulfide reductase family protein [Robiginitalea sp.]|nr:TlpA disulfide reductase family protein [Robiginitalea sp.]